MLLYRLSKYPEIGGVGGLYEEGRWHSKGQLVFYASESPALALIETLAHLKVSLGNMPITHLMTVIEVADGAVISKSPRLPSNWAANIPTSRAVGDTWLKAGKGLLLPVPCAIVAGTNYVINPKHPQAGSHLKLLSEEPYWFDPRHAL